MHDTLPTLQRQREEGEVLASRLLAAIPAATFEMETLVRLAGIKATSRIPTAAVECLHRPHLLLNPEFIARHCERNEHLFLLVMHEMWHIILAHTRLYPRATLAHNIAFDAIINAGLMRQFNRPEYRGFFESVNPADTFPACLLRPPVGWPLDPQYPDEDFEPHGTRRIIEQLYPPKNFSRWSAPLYEEILDLLNRHMDEKKAKGESMEAPVLLGDHDGEGGDGRALEDPLFGDMVRRVAEGMPLAPFASPKRGEGVDLTELTSNMQVASEAARRAFAAVLQRSLGPQSGGEQRRTRVPLASTSGIGVMPNARDRLASARGELGVQGVLWSQPGMVRVRARDMPSMANVYLDVSGSMSKLIPLLVNLLLPYVAKRRAAVYQFSTAVEPLPLKALRSGALKTTYGTNINCVLRHAIDSARHMPLHRILVLTDGMTGKPHYDLLRELQEAHIHLIAVISGETAYTSDLSECAHILVVLPPLH